ncbi:uncharacterized protein [Anoplolepis gracilipes]|uniref:uncharacterized protein n=1 Tax=Anoplolepis gracilipes TaxID=354296 RepID=UPI003BA336B2
MVENGCDLGIVADPLRIPHDDDRWEGDTLGSGGYCSRTRCRCPSPRFARPEEGICSGGLGAHHGGGGVPPPRLSVWEYGGRLDDLAACLRGPTVVAGDFNAHSPMCGSPRTNSNGRLVETWAAAEVLRILNQGSGNTFVGHRSGFSIVDLTWASPAALRKVSEWRMLDHVETGSDYLYVWFRVILTRDGTVPPPITALLRRL